MIKKKRMKRKEINMKHDEPVITAVHNDIDAFI